MIFHTILEDCSPYYIRFTFPELSNIISYVNGCYNSTFIYCSSMDTFKLLNYTQHQDKIIVNAVGNWRSEPFDIDTGTTIVDMLPVSKLINLQKHRVNIFNTSPDGGVGIHKDGADKISLNISLCIEDLACKTYWYSAEQFSGLQEVITPVSRIIHKNHHTAALLWEPIKTLIQKPNEAILFNTGIWHSWHNTSKVHNRKVLTFRSVVEENISFDDAKKRLFNV